MPSINPDMNAQPDIPAGLPAGERVHGRTLLRSREVMQYRDGTAGEHGQ